MTALVWDLPGEHYYETGVDRGVLYFPALSAYAAWNGLVSVTETLSRELKSYFLDGVKYLDHLVPGAYSGKVQAFTYPDLLDPLLGNREISPGVQVHDQPVVSFNLTYRTRIGNDILGSDFAYKIHLLYNLTATPSDYTYNTLSDSLSETPFEWTLSGTPDSTLAGKRPTAHASIDSRKADATKLATLEGKLYGTDTTNPDMPTLAELSGIFT